MKNLKELINQRKSLWADGKRPTTEERLKVQHAISGFWESNHMEIGNVGLSVVENDGAYYWATEESSRLYLEEITKELYDALITFNTKKK